MLIWIKIKNFCDSVILGDYEKTISQMLTKREEEKKEHEAMIKKIEAERDSTVQHLNNLENAFNDIHQWVIVDAKDYDWLW